MKTVLIGEDEPDVSLALKSVFDRAGYRVLTAADGATALDMACRWMPDLMILDLGMPHMSGLEVCRALRADPAIAHTPVMMVSGWGFTTDLEAGTEAGANDYVVKPFDKDDLLARAEALMIQHPRPTPHEETAEAVPVYVAAHRRIEPGDPPQMSI
jgi:DNA-binding response OmpR family regulator